MKSLLIDTSTSHVVASLFSDKILLKQNLFFSEKDLSSKMLPTIDKLLKDSDVFEKDIEKIYTIVGPGSFTGIRIGVTISKTMAYVGNKKVIPISSLELLATTPFIGDYIVSLIDARRGFVFAGMYDHTLKNKLKDCYINLEQLIEKLPNNKNIVFVSYDVFDKISTIKPNIDTTKIVDKYFNEDGINPHQLNPNYLKLTEAEENFNKK